VIIEKKKPIRIIGYPESSMTDGALQWFLLESKNEIQIITPEVFLDLPDKDNYQYFVGFYLDMNLRKIICEFIDDLNLDCITYIHDSCVVFNTCKIGKGVFIGAFSTVAYYSEIGNHCWIECYCLIAHDDKLGRGSVMSAGALIAGKTTIGEYCNFGFKSSVLNKITITDNVTIGGLSNVTKDIAKPGRYVGSIARYIGE
jgi:acetyltransferase-like isoleucine patch superfamily enzyme